MKFFAFGEKNPNPKYDSAVMGGVAACWALSCTGRRHVLSVLLVWTEIQILRIKIGKKKGTSEKCGSSTRGCSF